MVGSRLRVIASDKAGHINRLHAGRGIDFIEGLGILGIEIAPRWTRRKAPAGLFIIGAFRAPTST